MTHARTLAAAAVAAASLAAPAHAAVEPAGIQNNVVYTVSTSGSATLTTHVDATCVFQADRWTADYGPTTVHAVGTSTGGAWIEVRCELYQNGWPAGDTTWRENLPVLYGTDRMGFMPERNVEMCVTASALFAERYVDAPRRCTRI